jgi:hypothetical protein
MEEEEEAAALVAQSVCWMTGLPGFDPRQRKRSFPLASASKPALRPTQSAVQWILVVLSPGVKRGRGVTLTTHPSECRDQERVGAISPLPLGPAWRARDSFAFTFYDLCS